MCLCHFLKQLVLSGCVDSGAHTGTTVRIARLRFHGRSGTGRAAVLSLVRLATGAELLPAIARGAARAIRGPVRPGAVDYKPVSSYLNE